VIQPGKTDIFKSLLKTQCLLSIPCSGAFLCPGFVTANSVAFWTEENYAVSCASQEISCFLPTEESFSLPLLEASWPKQQCPAHAASLPLLFSHRIQSLKPLLSSCTQMFPWKGTILLLLLTRCAVTQPMNKIPLFGFFQFKVYFSPATSVTPLLSVCPRE